MNLNDQKQWDDINVIAGALKLFLRELAEPLIPYAHFGPFLEIIRMIALGVCVCYTVISFVGCFRDSRS